MKTPMKTLQLVVLALLSSAAFAQSQLNVTNTPIQLTGWNQDLIVDAKLNGDVNSLRTWYMDKLGNSFYVTGFSTNSTPFSNGLPTNGKLTSPSGVIYQLQPYDRENALRIESGVTDSLTLKIPCIYNGLNLAMISTDGTSNVSYTVNYIDGSFDNGSLSVADWNAHNSNYIITNLGRVHDQVGYNGTGYSIYEYNISTNASKPIRSVQFTTSGGVVSVFAVSGNYVNGQTIANAGGDKVIYLTQTNQVTLDGSLSNGDNYHWQEISTDYMSAAKITSPDSKVTTVTGLPQGTFYFRISASSGGITKTDSMKVIVDYDVSPSNSTLVKSFDMSSYWILKCLNYRGDTTTAFPTDDQIHSQCGDGQYAYTSQQWWTLYRDRTKSMEIDSLRGKMYTSIEDGYARSVAPNGTRYARAEIQMDDLLDTNHIYVYEWKGYLPHPPDSNYLVNNNGLLMMLFQIHGANYDYAIMNFELRADGLYFRNEITGSKNEVGNDSYQKESAFISSIEEFYNKTHTLRITLREGLAYPGQKAFVKVELDGVTKYYRNKGGVGSAYFDDYVKMGSLYDWSNAITNPDLLSRGRKFSIANESLKKYILTETPSLISAGQTQYITLPSNSAALNGLVEAGSSPVTSCQWTKVSGGNATITNPSSLSATVTGLTKGNYLFNLKITDNNDATSSSNVQVIVDSNRNIDVSGYNYDVIVDNVLNGTVSSLRNHDVDGSGFSFYANGFSPTSTALTNGLPSNGIIISPTNAVYQLQPFNQNNALWLASGGTGTLTLATSSKFDKIKIALTSGGTNVGYKINYSDGSNDVISHSIGNWACQSCTSFAINDLGRTNNSGTMDNNVWAIYEDSILPNPNKTVNSITFTSSGSFLAVFALVNIPKTAANIPPTGSAGSNQTITLPTNTVTLSGSGKDSDGTIASYQWTKVSGPSSYTISNASSATTSVKGLIAGIYVFKLTVTDNQGATAADSLTITVNPAANIPPTASVGSTQTITLPTNTVSLTGTGTDSDGTIASYQWTKVSGPSSYTISNGSSATTSIKGLIAGNYVFKLTVTDNQGATATDTVLITVNPAANIPPTASAGSSQTITLPTNTVTLSGSGKDSDGTIASYQWTKVSGPSSYTIGNASSATTSVKGLIAGIYVFKLTVTDNQGATAADSLTISVNPCVL
jgi:hypothetical protein